MPTLTVAAFILMAFPVLAVAVAYPLALLWTALRWDVWP